MRRRIAAFLAAVVVGGTAAVLAPASPASADVCAGTGVATTAVGLLYPIGVPLISTTATQLTITFNDEKVNTAFAFSFSVGACLPPGGSLNVPTGTLNGYCGHSAGTGTDTAGHLFGYTSVGTFLFITHQLTGVASAIPDVAGGQSCAHGGVVKGVGTVGPALPAGATRFLVTGAVNRVSPCSVETLTTGLTTVVPTTSVLTTLPVPVPNPLSGGTFTNIHVRTPQIEIHTSLHNCIGLPL